jgi:hypothetical protein
LAIDVHEKESQMCILAEGGELIEQRIRAEAERFAAVLGERSRARIVIEASTESERGARCLEGVGHEVCATAGLWEPCPTIGFMSSTLSADDTSTGGMVGSAHGKVGA